MYYKNIMEYNIDDKYKNILQKYLDKKCDIDVKNETSDSESDSDQELVYDKELYTKFYDLLNNISLFFIVNTFETVLNNLTDNFDLNNANSIIKNHSNINDTFKLQLNIIWSEFDNSKNHDDKLIVDFNDLINLNIIKHKYCLFTFIKANVLSLFKEICKLQFTDEVKNKNELIEKIAKFSNAILIVNKFTGLEDEDEFECIDCNNQYCDVFWK